MKKVAILGSGMVGQALARGFLKYGCEVVIGTQNPSKKIDWPPPATRPQVMSYEQAAQRADILVLAVKGPSPKTWPKPPLPTLVGRP